MSNDFKKEISALILGRKTKKDIKSMNCQTIAIIQARMSSKRLPGKVLMPLAARPLLWHIYNQVSHCQGINKVIVATSQEKSDDKIEDFCRKNNIEFFRGSLDNVLERFNKVIDKYKPKYVSRICGDTPFLTPKFIDSQIKALKAYDGDMIISKDSSCFFEGQDVYSVRALRQAYLFSKNKLDLEQLGSFYFAKNLNKLRLVGLKLPKELVAKDWRLTIDTPEDYQLVSKIYEDLFKKDRLINLRMVKDWLNRNPELAGINKNISMKSYFERLQRIKRRNLKRANIVGEYTFSI